MNRGEDKIVTPNCMPVSVQLTEQMKQAANSNIKPEDLEKDDKPEPPSVA